MKRRILIALAGLCLTTGSAWAVPVGLELVLLVDVSGSVSAGEYNLQKQGYVDAFQSAAVENAILGSVGGAIAVTYVEWSGNNQHLQQVGWTLIDSASAADDFADDINATEPGVFRQHGHPVCDHVRRRALRGQRLRRKPPRDRRVR